MFKALFVVLLFPAQAGEKPSPQPARMTVAGLTVLVSPPRYGVGLSGITASSTVEAAGGTGTLVGTSGIAGPRTVAIRVKEARVEELVAAIGDGLPQAVKDRLKGRIGLVTIDVKGDDVTLKATGFRIRGDPVQRIEATANLKTRAYRAKLYAFGGLAEAEGFLPEEK